MSRLRRHNIKAGIKRIARGVKRRLLGPPLDIPSPMLPVPWHPLAEVAPLPDARLKVLVLSHMYPHPQQPLFGTFVHEQVKALRQYQHIDARVLVGRPYWMSSKNPRVLLRMNKQYRLFHSVCTWFNFDAVPVKYLPYRVMGPFWTHGLTYRAAICRGIDRLHQVFPFALIHAHTSYLDGSAGLALAKRYGVPLLITEHTGPFSSLMSHPVVKYWTRQALYGAAHVIAVSTKQQHDIAAYMALDQQTRLLVLPNGVDINNFYPPATWHPDPQAPRLLFVGYFVPVKNLSLLLEAFALVLRNLTGARLTLVGGGEVPQQVSELQHLTQRMGLERQVTFLGPQPHTAVARIMREEADLLVLSSQAETFGCVLIEALACGKPVVSTRSGGPEDIITADFLGEFCVNGSPEALAQAIVTVASKITTYTPARIRQYIEDHFSYTSVTSALAELYREMCYTGMCMRSGGQGV